MAKKKKDSEKEADKVPEKKPAVQKVVLPDTCIVVVHSTSRDFKINHDNRTSIVIGDPVNSVPATYALRTDPKQKLSADKMVYAMGTGSPDGETGLVGAKSVLEAVVLIAHLNKISELCLAPCEDSIQLKKALLKEVSKKGLNIRVH